MVDNSITQVTGKGVIKPLKGIILIVGLVAVFFALDFLLRFLVLIGLSSTVSTVLLYAITVILFIFIMKRFCIVHMYTMDTVKLLLYRIYFKNPRFMEQVLFRECAFFGDPETAARKYLIKKTTSYIGHRDKYAVQSLIVKDGKAYRQILLTPNEELCRAILSAVKKS